MTARDELIEVMAEGIFTAGVEAAATGETWELAHPAARDWARTYARGALRAMEVKFGELIVQAGQECTCGRPPSWSGFEHFFGDTHETHAVHRLITPWTATPTSRGTSS